MSETYPRKTYCETLYAGHISPSVGFDCKGSELFWIDQKKYYYFEKKLPAHFTTKVRYK